MSPPQEFLSDHVVVETAPDGTLQYFRAGDPEREEYTYRKPFILEFEITRRCNLKCVHCYASASDSRFDDELTFDEIRPVLDDGRSVGVRELSLTGGEVCIHPQFIEVVDAALERDYNVRFVTNATLVTDDLVRRLGARPIKLITVSLDSIAPEVHDRIRGRGSHAAALDGIERLLGAGFYVSIITAFSNYNLGEFDAILDFCVRHDVDWQAQMTSAKGRCPREITLSPAEYYALGEKLAAALAADLPINIVPMDDMATFSHFAPLSLLSETWQGQCTGGLLNIFVRANGDVTPCSALCFPECIVGNVRKDSLEDICREERCKHALSWLRPDNLTGVCADCCFKEQCRGGCPDILLSMCANRTENEYCYHRIEQARILGELDGA